MKYFLSQLGRRFESTPSPHHSPLRQLGVLAGAAVVAVLVLGTSTASALTAGDIAIIGLNTDDDDQIAFLALNDIPANTTITFTDNPWTSATGPFGTSEGYCQWSHTSVVKAGTVIAITGVSVWASPTTTLGSVTKGGNLDFSTEGDQVIAFADTWGNRPTTPSDSRFLYAISSTGFTTLGSTTAKLSYLPSALGSASTSFSGEKDDQYYADTRSGITSLLKTNTPSSLLAAITDGPNKWYRSDTAPSFPIYTMTVLASEPSTAPDAPTFMNVQSLQIGVGLSGGSGTCRLVVCQDGAAPTTAPVDGTTYTANAAYGSGTALGSGYVVYSGSGGSFTMTGLTASHTYYFRVYGFNGVAASDSMSGLRENYKTDGYGSAYQATSSGGTPALSAGTVAGFGNQEVNTPSTSKSYNLSGTSLTPDSGNIAVSPPAGFEVSLDQSTWVASGSLLTVAYTGGALATTPIHVRFKPTAIQPYGGDVTYSGGGAATPPITALSGTGVYGSASDIIADTGFTYPQNFAYGSYQETDLSLSSLAVAQFILRDGGASADGDSAVTTLTAITFNVANSSNLRRVALYDGITELGEVEAGASVTFSGFGVTAADGGTKTLTLRASFRSTVTDNQQFSFTLISATASTSGSGFAAANAGGAASSTDGNNNRIAVVATKLVFSSVPASVSVNQDFSTTVEARDANENVDVDATTLVSLTKFSGSGALTGGGAQNLSSGSQTWSALQMDTGGGFTIQAAGGGLASATSGTITAAYLTQYRSKTSGDWNATATWEQSTDNGANWEGATAAPTSSDGAVTIRNGHTVTVTAAVTVNQLTVADGGTLDLNGENLTGTATISSGGTLKGNGTVTGVVTVNSGGTVAPGSSIGTLTFDSSPSLGGGTVMEIDKDASPNADKVALRAGTLTYGGTLTVTKPGAGTLATGDSFTLFTASGFSGWFGSVSLPVLASGLSWDTNKLATSGVLDIYAFGFSGMSLSTPKNTAAKLSVAKLLTKATTARGTTALESVSATSANGGTVSSDGTEITFTPAADATTADSFTCVLKDGHGSVVVTVYITITNPNAQSPNIISVAYNPGTATIVVAGVPNVVFRLEYSEDLSTWADYGGGNQTVDGTGVATFTHTSAPGSAFYRTVHVSGP